MKRLTTKEILALGCVELKALPADAVIAIAKLLENYQEQKQKEDFISALTGKYPEA